MSDRSPGLPWLAPDLLSSHGDAWEALALLLVLPGAKVLSHLHLRPPALVFLFRDKRQPSHSGTWPGYAQGRKQIPSMMGTSMGRNHWRPPPSLLCKVQLLLVLHQVAFVHSKPSKSWKLPTQRSPTRGGLFQVCTSPLPRKLFSHPV